VSLVGVGQGRKIDGLKTGTWHEKFEDAYRNYTKKGNYKIIPLAKYDTIGELGDGCYRVNYRGYEQLLFFAEKVKEKVAVKDSIWNSYDEMGRLREIDYWAEGLNVWTKYFDKKGQLTRYDYEDFEHDTSFQLTYLNGQLFKKAFYPPENKNSQTVIYYPEESLNLTKAEFAFTVNLLSRPIDTEQIMLRSKKDITISAISTTKEFISILTLDNQPVCLPLMLLSNDSVILKIVASPVAANYEMTDTISILTTENKQPYKVYSNIYAHHLDGRTIKTVKTLTLSKKRDKYLILPSMGTVTDATLVSPQNQEYYFEIKGTEKIDLSKFPSGNYKLIVSSCHTGGRLSLILTE